MSTVIRICNKEENKYTGFELSKNENICKIFPHGVNKGFQFKVGQYDYKVTSISIDGFYENINRVTLDDTDAIMDTLIWICCDTEDPRIKEGQIDGESIASDLGLI